jgi:branched-subunit amino acid ABC-type transport system permease component
MDAALAGAALAQAVVNGLLTGALIAVPAIGFTMIFAVLRFPDFAVASYATIGAFAGWWVNVRLGLGVVPVLAAAFVVTGLLGVAAEHVALKPLRNAGALTVAIGSIALNLVLENAVRFTFGGDLRGFDLPLEQDFTLGPVRMGPQQIQNLGLALVVLALVFGFLRYSRFGRAMRAVADNADLARLKGIDPGRIAALAVLLGAGLSGVGGVLLGFDTSIDPLTGYRVVLSVFAAAVLGGLGSITGAVVGALVLGVAEELALLAVPATYRTAIGFAAILLMLTFRPRGLLGERA